jgi:hypothetical protein
MPKYKIPKTYYWITCMTLIQTGVADTCSRCLNKEETALQMHNCEVLVGLKCHHLEAYFTIPNDYHMMPISKLLHFI